VEVAGAKGLMAACVTPVTEGMVVMTHSAQVRQMRKILYELMLSDHPTDCLHCDRNGRCEFQDLGEVLQIKESRFAGNRSKNAIDDSSPAIIRDTTKCILCRRCVSMCNEVQGVGALNAQNRGFQQKSDLAAVNGWEQLSVPFVVNAPRFVRSMPCMKRIQSPLSGRL